MDFRVDWESVRPVRINFRSRFNLLNLIDFLFWELALKLHVRLYLKFKSEPPTRKRLDILGFVSL